MEEPPLSWFDAEEHCNNEGGKLVEIDSEEENTALVDEINRRGYSDRNMHFWIGLNELEVDGDWRLASNGLEPTYLNWHAGEPNEEGSEHCARLRIGPSPYWRDTWSDVGCSVTSIIQGPYPAVSMHALCEFETSTESPPTEHTSTTTTAEDATSTEGTTTTEGVLTRI